MRGKLIFGIADNTARRNIPAYAGKTTVALMQIISNRGTSPRMRGKRSEIINSAFGTRNIPAYAGKTILAPSAAAAMEHPRVCGEN